MHNVRFTCQPGCTNCCEATGDVFLTEDDLRNAAAFLRMTAADFETRYVFRGRKVLRLNKPSAENCVFLTPGKGCEIHPVKPAQCRLFPFWPELVENHGAWAAAAKRCPGIGKGDLIQIQSASEWASEMRRAYPVLYKRRG